MRCKHNMTECIKDELFCINCGMLIKKNKSIIGDTICETADMDKEHVKTIMEVGVLEENQTEKNIFPVCPKHVLDLFQEWEIKMTNPRCKMSIDKANIGNNRHGMYVNFVCGLALNVRCEGKRSDSNNCPFWKRGDGQP